MTNDATQLEIAELAQRVVTLDRRLKRHMDALDAGDISAAEDVSALTRILLAYGKGDKVIIRLCRTLHIPLPEFWVSPAPLTHRHVQVSIGHLPFDVTAKDHAQARKSKPKVVSFLEFLDHPALVCEGTQRRTYSWSRLADEFGNTWGSHLSVHVPAFLRRIEFMQVSGMTFAEFVVRQMGWFAEEAMRQVLPHAGVDYVAREQRTTFVGNVDLSHLALSRFPSLFGDPNPQGKIDAVIQFHEPIASNILRFEDRGRVRSLGILEGGGLFVEDKPST